ncbi:MAG: alpha/beta hydrolase-fold protein [Myxococcota bacterium]
MGHLHRLYSHALGRHVHVWAYGHFGMPVVVFPSASGMASEWDDNGLVHELGPLLAAGRIKLYCTESNVSETWTNFHADAGWRIHRHRQFETYVHETLVPFVHHDCRGIMPVGVAGASLGALYAANLALKSPRLVDWALCLSGRYELRNFTSGFDNADIYFNNPLAYVPGLHDEALSEARRTWLTLVVGQGPHEGRCIPETLTFAGQLADKSIPHELDVWGHDSAHEWPWWRRQVAHHFGRRFGG